jgi:hypothetical protein
MPAKAPPRKKGMMEKAGDKLRSKLSSLKPAIKAVEKKVNPKGSTSFPKKK